MAKAKSKSFGFTIVELLVVIVVIGILAAITVISYTGISQRAIAASLQSDLSGASKQLKMYQVEYGNYPAGIILTNGKYCPNPDLSGGRYCFRASPGNIFDIVSYLGTTQTFSLTAGSGSTSYVVTHTSPPTLVVVSVASATGGTITYTDSSGLNPRSSPTYGGGYTVHTFLASGTLTVTGTINNASLLIVGGGGGGNNGLYTAGGGAGQFMSLNNQVLSGSVSVTVGNGGAKNANGFYSALGSNISIGGGSGGTNGSSGASGGGASPMGIGGSGLAGHRGGDGANGGSFPCFGVGAGGGGGAGMDGGVGGNCIGGYGGYGLSSAISGITTWYAGGGAAEDGNGAYAVTIGGASGSANSGSGGGANGVGGSGIVIIRYSTQ